MYMKNNEDFQNIRRRLGLAVKRYRAARGLTQEKLALQANMGWRHLQKIEAGEVNATLLTLTQLAKALDVDPASLLSADEAS